MTAVPSQSAYEEAERVADFAPQPPQRTTPELVTAGAHCDLLEAVGVRRYHRRVSENERSLEQRLEEIGTQLAWVRDYL